MLGQLQVFDQLNSTSVIEDGKLADVFVTNYTVVGGNAFVEFRIDSFNSDAGRGYS